MGSMLPYIAAPWILWVIWVVFFFYSYDFNDNYEASVFCEGQDLGKIWCWCCHYHIVRKKCQHVELTAIRHTWNFPPQNYHSIRNSNNYIYIIIASCLNFRRFSFHILGSWFVSPFRGFFSPFRCFFFAVSKPGNTCKMTKMQNCSEAEQCRPQ